MHEDLGASLRRRKWVLWLMGRARWARTCSLWARSDSRRRALLAGDSLLFFGLTVFATRKPRPSGRGGSVASV